MQKTIDDYPFLSSNKTTREMADESGYCKSTVNRICKRFNITPQPYKQPKKDYPFLSSDKTTREMADESGYSYDHIRHLCARFNIKYTPKSGNKKLDKQPKKDYSFLSSDKTAREMADESGYSPKHIYQLCAKFNIQYKPPIDKDYPFLSSNKTTREMADESGFTIRHINTLCHRYGVNPMPRVYETQLFNEARSNKYEQIFIDRAKQLNGDNFSYDLVDYKTMHLPVILYCNKHNIIFNQTPDSHLKGSGCQICKVEKMNLNRVVKPTQGIYNPNSKNYNPDLKCYVYLLNFKYKDEKFIKVGVTNNIKSRLRRFKPYQVQLLDTIDTTSDYALKLESKIHNDLNEYRYTPKIKFGGYTECFDYNLTNLDAYII